MLDAWRDVVLTSAAVLANHRMRFSFFSTRVKACHTQKEAGSLEGEQRAGTAFELNTRRTVISECRLTTYTTICLSM
jgi:hypothetical protein